MEKNKNILILIVILAVISSVGYYLEYIDFDLIKYVIIIVLALAYYFKKASDEFDSKNKYLFFTDESLKTSTNDKDGHIDIYYDIDLRKNKVIKKKDQYVNFKGKVKEEVLKSYIINNSKKKKIRKIFDNIIKDMDKELDTSIKNSKHYVLRCNDGLEIVTYNYDLINEFESIFK